LPNNTAAAGIWANYPIKNGVIMFDSVLPLKNDNVEPLEPSS